MTTWVPVMPNEIDHIWNGWRASYVQQIDRPSPTTTDSIFRRILDSGLPDEETNIVHRGRTCFVIMNAFPYTVGHMLILPYRQVARLETLDPDEFSEIWELTRQGVIALEAAYAPAGINVGLNMGEAAGGSVSEHLHLHVLPRWIGDGNFITAVANTRSIPEPLVDTAAKLRAAWPVAH